jgi:hypothetical protein
MVMHEISAHFVVKASAVAAKQKENPDGLPDGVAWFRHFDGFTLTPWGGVVVHSDRINLCHTITTDSSSPLPRKSQ